jgi:hypothetical protein
MAVFFAKRVESGLKLWTKVPNIWYEATLEQIKEDGYILNEDGTVTKEAVTE